MKPRSLISSCALLLAPAITCAATWNESLDGDISTTQASPSTLLLTEGVNSLIGSVGSGDSQDWITLTVASGFTLNSFVLESYNSTDPQGFTGMQAGTVFAGSAFNAGSYLGYAHFGTAADNGSLPPDANLVGDDLLPIMNNATGAPGAQGFSIPLAAGSYAWLIQQTGSAATSYQFSYNVVPVPEPTSAGLFTLCAFSLLGRRRPSIA